MPRISRYTLILAAIAVMAVYIPDLFDLAFAERVKKTHIFYSPVIKKFIWRDKLLEIPEGATEHHAQFVQYDQDGNAYSRREFEELLPFIYYRNMDLWGKLPLTLEGRTFDKDTIKRSRQVVELKPEQIAGNAPQDEVLPLMESAPDMARLVFPEDRFRLGQEMEFINADDNTRDEGLTIEFTNALKDAGFRFPGRLASGKPTILKPFDEGVFLVDADGAVFHVKRVNGKPEVIKTPIAPSAGVRTIKVSENQRRQFYGIVLTNDGRLSLLSYDNYRLIPLPVHGYDPNTMDFKLIINPLYRTASYSDSTTIRAVAMDRNYHPVARYEHTMPGANITSSEIAFRTLTPFSLDLGKANSGYLSMGLSYHGTLSAMVCLLIAGGFLLVRARKQGLHVDGIADCAIVALTGVYGLIAVTLLPDTQA